MKLHISSVILLLGGVSLVTSRPLPDLHGDINLLVRSYEDNGAANLPAPQKTVDTLDDGPVPEDRGSSWDKDHTNDLIQPVWRKKDDADKQPAGALASARTQNQDQLEPKKLESKQVEPKEAEPKKPEQKKSDSEQQIGSAAEAPPRSTSDKHLKGLKDEAAEELQENQATLTKTDQKEKNGVEKEPIKEANEQVKRGKMNKRARKNHQLELKANKLSAVIHINNVKKVGLLLEMEVKKQKDRNKKSIEKQKGNLDQATKQLENAKKAHSDGKQNDKNLKKAKDNLKEAKDRLERAEKKSKDSLDEINYAAELNIVALKIAMFRDWEKHNRDEWETGKHQGFKAKKHLSNAEWAGIKFAYYLMVYINKSVSNYKGFLNPVKKSIREWFPHANFRTGRNGVLLVDYVVKAKPIAAHRQAIIKSTNGCAGIGKDFLKPVKDTKQNYGTSTYDMNSAEDDKNIKGIETNSMKIEIQNQMIKLEKDFDAAANATMKKFAIVKRALEDTCV